MFASQKLKKVKVDSGKKRNSFAQEKSDWKTIKDEDFPIGKPTAYLHLATKPVSMIK